MQSLYKKMAKKNEYEVFAANVEHVLAIFVTLVNLHATGPGEVCAILKYLPPRKDLFEWLD